MALIGTSQVVITLIDYQFTAVAATSPMRRSERPSSVESTQPSIWSRSLRSARAPSSASWVWLGPHGHTGPPRRQRDGLCAGPQVRRHRRGKVASKAFDYSLFRAAKEILYIPLSHPERTQGKTFVDMMAYRMAKAERAHSCWRSWPWPALLALAVTIACLLLWIWLTLQLNRRHSART